MKFIGVAITKNNLILDLCEEANNYNFKFFLSDKPVEKRAVGDVPKVYNLNVHNSRIIMNLDDVFSFFYDSNIIQLYCLSNKKYISLECPQINTKDFSISNNFIITKKQYKKDYLVLINEEGNFQINNLNLTRVFCRKRIDGIIGYHYKEEYTISYNKNIFNIDYQKIIDFLKIKDNDIVDLFIEYDGMIEPLRVDKLDNSYKQIEEVIYRNYVSTNNVVSIFFASKTRFYLNKLIKNDNNLLLVCDIRGEVNKIDFDKIGLVLINDNGYIKKEISNLSVNYKTNYNEVIISINDFEENIFKYIDSNTKIGFSIIPNTESIETIIENKTDKLVYNLDNINISVKKGKRREAIFKFLSPIKNIAIFGSCHSRRAFTETDYFNLDYKLKYNVVYTQFHSTIESIVCNIPRTYNNHYFKHFHPVIQDYIETDFSKTFFENLKSSNAEYLIIDLYADAQKYTIEFEDCTKITSNAYLNRRSNYLLENCQDVVEIHNPLQDEEYLEKWKFYVHDFVEKVKAIIDEDKIVINFIQYAKQYRSKSGIVKVYPNINQNYIVSLNAITDYMQQYLATLLPKAKILDIREFGFIGDENHPDGLLIDHFESVYYKAFLNELNHILKKNL